MKKIYNNNEVELWKSETIENTYRIQLNHESNSLLKSILKTNIILGATISNEFKTLHFKAVNVKPFFYFKSIVNKNINLSTNDDNIFIKLMYFLTKQIDFLITIEKKCFYKLHPNNIFIIDDYKFIYLSNEYLIDINENNRMQIQYPFEKHEWFDSPEILELDTLPTEIHYKTVYYSLASIAIYLLLDNDNDNDNENENNKKKEEKKKKINKLFELIEGTKLFGFLKRCLRIVPEKRSILFI